MGNTESTQQSNCNTVNKSSIPPVNIQSQNEFTERRYTVDKEISQSKRNRLNNTTNCSDSIDSIAEYMSTLQPFTFSSNSHTTIQSIDFTNNHQKQSMKSNKPNNSSVQFNINDLPGIDELVPSTISTDILSKLHSTLLSFKHSTANSNDNIIQLHIELNTNLANTLLDNTIRELHAKQTDSIKSQIIAKNKLAAVYTTIESKQEQYESIIQQQNQTIRKLQSDLQSGRLLHQTQWNDINSANTVLIQQCNQRSNKIDELLNTIQQLQQQIYNEQCYNNEHAAIINNMQTDIDFEAQRYTTHVQELTDTISELTNKLDITNQQIDQLTHSLSVAHNEIQSHHESQIKLNADASQQIDSIKLQYDTELQHLTQKIDQLTQQVNNSDHEINLLQNDLQHAVTDLDTLNSNNTILLDDNAQLKQQLDTATNDIVSLQTQIQQYLQSIDKLEHEIDILNNDIDSGDIEYNKLIDENKSLIGELNRVRSVVKQTITSRNNNNNNILQSVTNLA